MTENYVLNIILLYFPIPTQRNKDLMTCTYFITIILLYYYGGRRISNSFILIKIKINSGSQIIVHLFNINSFSPKLLLLILFCISLCCSIWSIVCTTNSVNLGLLVHVLYYYSIVTVSCTRPLQQDVSIHNIQSDILYLITVWYDSTKSILNSTS